MTNLSQRSGLYLWATRIALALFSTAMFLILVKLGFWQLYNVQSCVEESR
ncbi:hypothetical protein FM038_001045 [Shewanella eurypsychrophilus]|uniref:Uncharacterized protein n=1 Tax=Shewanella eurypsychrophilus TaxID=2593656 RepID=A0ABX8S362_9GAMM|nr:MULTISPECIES: hypothetical protein [Shewanella]QXP44972.1 hypothetical protein FM038_001045 [Shewanella eurypsychrophilus]